MAKGPLITDKARQFIAEVYLQHRDWRAKEIQTEVDNRLNGNGPGLSAVQKILTKIREREGHSLHANLDAPWSLGSLGIKPEYELPPEIISLVLALKRDRELEIKRTDPKLVAKLHRKMRVDELEKLPGWVLKFERVPHPFSIREAKWVARISRVLADRVTTEGIGSWTRLYADYEKACELVGVACDTSVQDIALLNGDIGAYFRWTLSRDIPVGKQAVQDYERRLLSITLEDIEFTPLGWVLYEMWLNLVKDYAKKWPNLSLKERVDFVKRLRDWVTEKEPVEELIFPNELLTEVDYVRWFGK